MKLQGLQTVSFLHLYINLVCIIVSYCSCYHRNVGCRILLTGLTAFKSVSVIFSEL